MKKVIVSIFILILSYIFLISYQPIIKFCDLNKCPYCYGTDLCEKLEKDEIKLNYNNWHDVIFNHISVKNLYVADYNGKLVMLKKLANQQELAALDNQISSIDIDETTNWELLNKNKLGHFKTCDSEVSEKLLRYFDNKYSYKELWTLLNVNVEPLILQIFKNEDDWPVPKYYGACGRLVMVKHCGQMLNEFEIAPWSIRLHLAYQLINAAFDFTEKHPSFRLYLTDISPDNIVVDDDLKLYFVDLENVILNKNIENVSIIHHSEHFDDEDGFAFSEEQICNSSKSDHNIYAICHLLLSKNAPWPMMKGGLLHSTPSEYSQLTDLIENCVKPNSTKINRFEIAKELANSFESIIMTRNL